MTAAQDSSRFALIYELANAFARRLELDELIPFALGRCREILRADGVSILLLDSEKDELYFPYVAEGDPEAARRLAEIRVPSTFGVAGAVLQSGNSELITDTSTDARYTSSVDDKTGTPTGSLLAAPLLSGSTRLGVIEAVRRTGAPPFVASEMALLELLAGSVAVALENAGRFEQVKKSAQQLRAQVGALRRELARNDRFAEIIAVSPAMSEVFTMMEAAAASGMNVLIQGETGTGKELVARAIHRTSTRADAPFIALNCAAVPEGLLESELFGYRKGAFSGASEDQAGLFKAASSGVIFLDEIGEMPITMQAKLLRVIQEGELKPVGDTRSQKIDVRVISATNRRLETEITTREDIPLLATRLTEVAAGRYKKRITGFQPSTLDLLTSAPWPGNVRQMQNEIERAVALARDGETLATHHLSREFIAQVENQGIAPLKTVEEPAPRMNTTNNNQESAESRSLIDARAAFEANYIAETLARHRNNVSHAAIALGVSRVTLQKKMKEYSLR
jgi:Nif-specific regulatory protein